MTKGSGNTITKMRVLIQKNSRERYSSLHQQPGHKQILLVYHKASNINSNSWVQELEAKLEMSYSHSWGQSKTESKTVTMGSENSVSMPLREGFKGNSFN